MLSPRKRVPNSPSTAAPLKKGLFRDGTWCCNCPERPSAIKFQVRKEGPNHGRWFYTCQKPQIKRCGFFLWAEEAELREKEVVLANSRSEEEPRTPSKPFRGGTGLLTPQTERRIIDIPPRQFKSPPKSAKARMMAEDTDDFGWNTESDDNAELAEALSSSQATEPLMSQPNFHPESPSKAARTPTMSSPGKRKLTEFGHDYSSSRDSTVPTPSSTMSSLSAQFPPSSAEVCMTPTPSKYRNVLNVDAKPDASNLASDVLALLEKHDVVMANRARDDLVGLLNLQNTKVQGIRQGRDILREALKKKDQEILQLKEGNVNLKAQSTMDQNMINSFKETLKKKNQEILQLKEKIKVQSAMDQNIIE
ncbi:uncharacterized protein N7459_000270 [Penicillium hispanicum]|uniref:uncharacterized protein n=1 Tax=Penicillium hispanicum TaxID=1080232 RepID=UPI0025411063|nr:uncharacterized protein N7459_000270 [Penicillium hispanicum]KAJ5594062.1 hypothetical protein N7459_000270 [Penicillium hispanicum]